MDDAAKDDAQTMSRYRSPSFSKQEITLLVNLVEQYKLFTLNKSVTSAANQAKEAAWTKITRQFNNANLGHIRNHESLRMKWENLKRDVKRQSKNLFDPESHDLDEVKARVLALVSAADSLGSIDAPMDTLEDNACGEQNDTLIENGSEEQKESSGNLTKFWEENIESEAEDDETKSKRPKRSSFRNRSQNFSPQDSKLLLSCVRKEKKHVFCKENTSKAIEIKNQAWTRIAEAYNKLSPQRRSAKCLRIKFTAMKKLAKKFGSNNMLTDISSGHGKHEKLIDDSFENIKKEPPFEQNGDSDQYSDRDDVDFHDNDDAPLVPQPDPLSSVLNGDSGIGSSSSQMGLWSWNQSENKEIVKLKTELLNYQLETAKLERKRVEEAMLEDTKERESRAIERSLRLRAARLDAVAASLRLPSAHPALQFLPEEAPAHQYLGHT